MLCALAERACAAVSLFPRGFFCTLSLEFFLFLGCCVILKFVGKWAFPSDTYHQAIRDEPQRTMYKHSLDSNSVFRIPSIMIMGTRTNVYRAHSLFLSLSYPLTHNKSNGEKCTQQKISYKLMTIIVASLLFLGIICSNKHFTV